MTLSNPRNTVVAANALFLPHHRPYRWALPLLATRPPGQPGMEYALREHTKAEGETGMAIEMQL